MDRIFFNTAKYRMFIILLSSVYVIFFSAQVILRNPMFEFEYNWDKGNTALMIVTSSEDSSLRRGDIITQVNGQPVIRGRQTFEPNEEVYHLNIIRNGVNQTTILKPTEDVTLLYKINMPAILLSIGFLLVGGVSLYYTDYKNKDGILLGLICLLTSVHIINTQAYSFNVRFGWVLYSLLAMFLFPAWIFMGFIPNNGLGKRISQFLKALIVFSIIFGIFSFIEHVFLYPQHKSYASLISPLINFNQILFIFLPLAFFICFLLSLSRWMLEESSYVKSQLKIISIGTGLAVIPALFFTFIPGSIDRNYIILPMTVTITLWILIPLSYAYVNFRRKYLDLDSVFKTGLTLLLTFLTLVILFALILIVVEGDSISVAIFSLSAVVAITLVRNPIQHMGTTLAANPGEKAAPQIIARFTAKISRFPEQAVMQNFLFSLAENFNIPQYAFFILNNAGVFEVYDHINVSCSNLKTVPNETVMRDPYSGICTVPLFDWADLGIPIIADERIIGFLAFSRPEHSYFTKRQRELLESSANLVGIALHLIDSIEAIQFMAAQQLAEQLQKKLVLSQQLHDRPMQQLTDLGLQMCLFKDQFVKDPVIQNKCGSFIEKVNDINQSLRMICNGMLPPMLHEGPGYILESVSDYAKRLNKDVQIRLQLGQEGTVNDNQDLNLAIYHIATEATTNAAKHAGATDIAIIFREGCLRIQDDGIGIGKFNINQLVREEHFGLAGMYNWAQFAGGKLKIETGNGNAVGTCVEFTWN